MKILHFFLAVSIILFVAVAPVWAADPLEFKVATPPGQKISEEEREKVQEIKERVATRVAELRQKIWQAFFGKIKDISENSFTLSTVRRGEITVLVDEETKIYRLGRGSRQITSLDDLVVGERVAVVGRLEPGEKAVTARFVFVKATPLNISGVVKAVEKSELSVLSAKGQLFQVLVKGDTKIRIWQKGQGLVKGKLEDIKVGDRVHVNGLAVKSEEATISAQRILVLPGRAVGITE